MTQTNNKKETLVFEGAELHQGQLDIVKTVLKSDAMYHTICTPRQFGKSFLAIQLMLYYALNYPNSKLMFCSPVYSQASKVYKELVTGIKDSGVIAKYNSAENSVILINGSEIYFKSVQIPDNLRGYSIDYLLLDEAAMYKPDVFSAVLRPMLTVRGKKCFLMSTPKGKNFFYELFLKGNDDEELRYKSYKALNDKNPYANQEEIAEAKKALPPAIFSQEYEAEFVEDGGSVFQNISAIATINRWQEPIAGETYYAGLDIAIASDFFVLTILNKAGDVVYSYRDNQKTMSFMLRQLEIALKKYNPRYTNVETNGIGKGIYENIERLHKSVKPFNTSNSSKQDIIEDLIYDVQEKKIHIPTVDFFPHYYNEMNTFTFEYSPKSHRVIYSGYVGFKDDSVMSLAFANNARKVGATKGIYALA